MNILLKLLTGKEKKVKRNRIFVPPTVFDNKRLLENDPGYIATLASLPEAVRTACIYGSWDSFEGKVFREFVNNPEHYEDQRYTHVIAPFRIPSHWRILRGFTLVMRSRFPLAGMRLTKEERYTCIREFYWMYGRA